MKAHKVRLACSVWFVLAAACTALGDWREPLTDTPEGQQATGYGVLMATTNAVKGTTNYVVKVRTDMGSAFLPLILPEKKDVSSLVGKPCKITAVIVIDRDLWGAEKPGSRRLRVVHIEQYDPPKGRPKARAMLDHSTGLGPLIGSIWSFNRHSHRWQGQLHAIT